jgi:undecaprenyl-diphosphatase
MSPVLNENTRAAKRFMLVLCMILSCGVGAEGDLGPAKERFFGTALWQDGRDLVLAPGSWDLTHWGIAATAVTTLTIFIVNDPAVYRQLRVRQDWQDSVLPGVTDMGDGFYSALGVAALWGGGALLGQDELFASSSCALESLALCAILSPALKYGLAAPRPAYDDQNRTFFNYSYPDGSPSFPSGHSLVAFSLAEVYGASYGRWWTYPLAGCVGYSRVYLGAHWPSDVLAGALLGIAIGHFTLKGRHEHGFPSWRFSVAQSGAGAAMAVARLDY